MSEFSDSFFFDPKISIEYNQEEEIYLGKLINQGRSHQIEGPNRAEVTRQLEDIAKQEYRKFLREISQDKSIPLGGGAAKSSVYIDRRERVIIKEWGPKGRLMHGATRGTEMLTLVRSIITGNWAELITGLLVSMGLAKAKYVAMVGSERITAGSKRALRKALMIKRNRVIQRVMHNVRKHQDETEKIRNTQTRLRRKKKEALQLGQKSWENRLGHTKNRTKGPLQRKKRVSAIQTRLKNKKDRSRDLWIGR